MVAHDVTELVDVVEPKDHHERARKLAALGAGAVARRLGEIKMQREQQRQQIVLEALRALAHLAREKRRVEKIEEGLLRIERGCDEVLGADQFAVGGLDPDRAAAFDHDALGLGREPDLAARFAHRRFERARERRRAAARHLRLGRARQQRGDVMAEAFEPQVNLAQAVEEEEARLDGGMLEFPRDEFERRERAHGEEPPAGAGAGKQRASLLRRQRWRTCLRCEDLLHDGHELVVPAPQRLGVAPAEGCERRDGAADVRPPFERAAVAGDERDVELGLDQARAVTLELEVGVPGHGGDRAQEEGVGVVEEAARAFERAQAAACRRAALDGKRLQAGLAEIGLQNESVMPGAEDNRVVGGHVMRAAQSSLPGLTPQVGFTRLAARNPAQLGQARVAVQSIHFRKTSCKEDGCAGHKRVHARLRRASARA